MDALLRADDAAAEEEKDRSHEREKLNSQLSSEIMRVEQRTTTAYQQMEAKLAEQHLLMGSVEETLPTIDQTASACYQHATLCC